MRRPPRPARAAGEAGGVSGHGTRGAGSVRGPWASPRGLAGPARRLPARTLPRQADAPVEGGSLERTPRAGKPRPGGSTGAGPEAVGRPPRRHAAGGARGPPNAGRSPPRRRPLPQPVGPHGRLAGRPRSGGPRGGSASAKALAASLESRSRRVRPPGRPACRIAGAAPASTTPPPGGAARCPRATAPRGPSASPRWRRGGGHGQWPGWCGPWTNRLVAPAPWAPAPGAIRPWRSRRGARPAGPGTGGRGPQRLAQALARLSSRRGGAR